MPYLGVGHQGHGATELYYEDQGSGTPVVLIETGPWPSAEPDAALVRLNFVAILSNAS